MNIDLEIKRLVELDRQPRNILTTIVNDDFLISTIYKYCNEANVFGYETLVFKTRKDSGKDYLGFSTIGHFNTVGFIITNNNWEEQ